MWRRFIWWGVGSSSAEGIFSCCWRHYSDALLRCFFGLSGAEDLAPVRFTSSLMYTPVIAPTLQIDPVGSSGVTEFFSTCPCTSTQYCTDTTASVYPVATGYSGAFGSDHPVLLTFAELVHFNHSLNSFFVFCFAWPFCFISGNYNCSLNKLISPIDCVVTQSPKSQNNGLMKPFFLQSPPFWWLMTTQSKQA